MKLDLRSFAGGALVAGLISAALMLPSRTKPEVPSAKNAARPDSAGRRDAAPAAVAAGPQARESAPPAKRTPEELRRALAAATTRLDQIRAITELTDDGSPEAMQALLDAFLASHDDLLLGLLQEAMLRRAEGLAPSLMAAFRDGNDPAQLDRLAQMLRKVAASHPDLSEPIVACLIAALDGPEGPRNAAAAAALQGLGRSVVDPLTALIQRPDCSPETAGAVAEILAKLPPEYAPLLRDKVSQGIDSTRDVLSDPVASEADKDLARKKTGSLAWTASSRSPAEHDSLAPLLAEQLGRTTDSAQAGTLAWGIGELRGLTPAGRGQAALTLLDSLSKQHDEAIRLIMSRSLTQLAQGGVAGSSDAIRNALASAEANESDSKVRAELQRMLEKLNSGK